MGHRAFSLYMRRIGSFRPPAGRHLRGRTNVRAILRYIGYGEDPDFSEEGDNPDECYAFLKFYNVFKVMVQTAGPERKR